jgi:glycerophosphoryl diester phosphodiesterase
MQIISHRGYWKTSKEKNQEIAFRRSFELGFGTETDVRDFGGNLVISHDPPLGNEMSLETFFGIYNEYDNTLPLALNIKCNGLQNLLNSTLEKYHISNYFVFDMSIPDMRLYINQEFNTFTRQSEIEVQPILYESVQGVWIDCFEDDWITKDILTAHLNANKKVCLVSPELHQRNHSPFWQQLTSMKILNHPNLLLCTDFPEEAQNILMEKM